jgi:hypothetical protein
VEKKPAWKCLTCGNKLFSNKECMVCEMNRVKYTIVKSSIRVTSGYVGGLRCRNWKRDEDKYRIKSKKNGSKR